MARNTIPKGKLVRRFGVNVFGNPKYDALLTRKPHGPGKSSNERRKRKVSEYGKSLEEKQKFRYGYGLTEKQVRRLYEEATRLKGDTGINMLTLVERRLDNLLFRSNFAVTGSQAKQMVSHGHVYVNGKKLNIPSYVVKEGDVVSVKSKNVSVDLVKANMELSAHRLDPEWLEIDKEKLSLKIRRLPLREEINFMGNEQLIIEYYSR